ncbi:unnamed protein product, partial [Sphacelaria rigidula]
EVDLAQASAAVAKAVARNSRGKAMLERVEPILASLEKYFTGNPNVELVYRSPDGEFIPGPAAVITKALVEGLAPEKFKRAVLVKLQHQTDWKDDPYLVMGTVVAKAKELRKIE